MRERGLLKEIGIIRLLFDTYCFVTTPKNLIHLSGKFRSFGDRCLNWTNTFFYCGGGCVFSLGTYNRDNFGPCGVRTELTCILCSLQEFWANCSCIFPSIWRRTRWWGQVIFLLLEDKEGRGVFFKKQGNWKTYYVYLLSRNNIDKNSTTCQSLTVSAFTLPMEL